MGTTTLVSVGEYLASDYEPDRDYVDGVLEERNRGETPHASLQALLAAWLVARRKPLGIWVTTEQRIHVGGTRFRVPDVCVVLGARPAERVLTQPPLLCVEILSPEDRTTRTEAKIADYFAMGVEYVWVIDPDTQQAWIHSRTEAVRQVTDGILRAGHVEVPLAELFEE